MSSVEVCNKFTCPENPVSGVWPNGFIQTTKNTEKKTGNVYISLIHHRFF